MRHGCVNELRIGLSWVVPGVPGDKFLWDVFKLFASNGLRQIRPSVPGFWQLIPLSLYSLSYPLSGLFKT